MVWCSLVVEALGCSSTIVVVSSSWTAARRAPSGRKGIGVSLNDRACRACLTGGGSEGSSTDGMEEVSDGEGF